MIKHNQDGAISGLGISLVMAVTLLVLTVVFAGWAFSSRQDFKNNVDAKIQVAVAAAQTQAAATEKTELAQNEMQPYYTYQGLPQYGNITFQYPRTWSAYVNNSGTSNSALVDGYYMPPILSSVSDQTANFALRFQVLNQSYSQTIQSMSGQSGGSNSIISRAFTLKLVPSVVGVEVSGALPVVAQGDTATMVILPDRTDTIEIWTDGTEYLSDFNNIILPTFSFSP
jgi:hypothetical protein